MCGKLDKTVGVSVTEADLKRIKAFAKAQRFSPSPSNLGNYLFMAYMDGLLLEKETVEANWIEVGPEAASAWHSLDDEDRAKIIGAIPRAAAGNPAQEAPKQSSGRKRSTRKKQANR